MTKTVQIDDEVWEKLQLLKIKNKTKTLNEVLRGFLLDE